MMSFRLLVWRSLWFRRREQLAVMLGVAVGAAVFAGALLVGDSLRGSLRARAERQRAGIDYALVAPRFFRAPVAEAFAPAQIESAILANGSAYCGDRNVSGISLIGGTFTLLAAEFRPTVDGCVLSASLARELGATIGSTITLRHSRTSARPFESLLGRRDDKETTAEWSITVAALIPDAASAAQFQLFPGASMPKNVYVPRAMLQAQVGSGETVNALFVRGGTQRDAEIALRSQLQLLDWGLTVKERVGYQSLESTQSIIEPALASTVRETTIGNVYVGETLVYLANRIGHNGTFIPYSVVAALETKPQVPPSPFLPAGIENLADDEIVLVDWPESPLRDTPVGAMITLTYFEPELRDGKQVENQASFRLRGRTPLAGVGADPHVAPEFPGLTDRLTIQTWDPPFAIDKSLIRKADEEYWKQYRTAPKAYITLAAGQKLWSSRYGGLTSIRVAPQPGSAVHYDLKRELLPYLSLASGGFVFEDLAARSTRGSRGGQDFGGLFLGFSCFLIAAALVLVGLLTRLNVERRASEVGLLLASGWSGAKVRRLLLCEGLLVAACGASVGLIGAVVFSWLMIRVLVRLWPDPQVGSFLGLHVSGFSLVVGWLGAMLMSAGMLAWALRGLRKISPSALLAGVTHVEESRRRRGRYWRRMVMVAGGSVLGIVALTAGGQLDNPMFRALSFFGGGALLLTAFLTLILHVLKREQPGAIGGQGFWALARLGARNASRHPVRSLLTTALLAAASFLLVAVESFRRHPERDFLQKSGGSGGFPLLLKTDLPVFGDLNSDARDDLLDALRIRYQQQPEPAGRSVKDRADEAKNILAQAPIYSLRVQGGDDASCLNLFQAGKPRLLGVPRSLRERGGFRFVASAAKSTAEHANPWSLLDVSAAHDSVIPVIAEENTVTWMLKLGLGGEFTITDDQGRPQRLRIVALLKDSVFQSEVLLAEEAFARLFPRTEGRTLHLVQAPPGQEEPVATLLNQGLAKKGPTIIKAQERVAAFMAVENTYLTTFQLLGGFGLMLGALGLAAALLRGIWERRGEFALLRAVGYRRQALGRMVLAENAWLLALGLGAGIGAATLSVVPHVSAGGSLPVVRLGVLLGLVTLTGFGAGAWAVRTAWRVPVLAALRKE